MLQSLGFFLIVVSNFVRIAVWYSIAIHDTFHRTLRDLGGISSSYFKTYLVMAYVPIATFAQMNTTELYWWYVNTDSGNSLMPLP